MAAMTTDNGGHGRVRVVDQMGRTGTAYYRHSYFMGDHGMDWRPERWEIEWDPFDPIDDFED